LKNIRLGGLFRECAFSFRRRDKHVASDFLDGVFFFVGRIGKKRNTLYVFAVPRRRAHRLAEPVE
jgi:hypothetical protein